MKKYKSTTHSPPLEGCPPQADGVVKRDIQSTPQADGVVKRDIQSTPQADGVVKRDIQSTPQADGVDQPVSFSAHISRNSKNYFRLPCNPKLKEKARALRKARNLAEVLLWKQLKSKRFKGLDFDRQKIIGNYIVDFYCTNCDVVIEVDGSSHDEKQKYDAQRDAFLESLGLTVIHISDNDVKKHLQATMRFLHDHPAFNGFGE